MCAGLMLMLSSRANARQVALAPSGAATPERVVRHADRQRAPARVGQECVALQPRLDLQHSAYPIASNERSKRLSMQPPISSSAAYGFHYARRSAPFQAMLECLAKGLIGCVEQCANVSSLPWISKPAAQRCRDLGVISDWIGPAESVGPPALLASAVVEIATHDHVDRVAAKMHDGYT